MIFYRTIKRLTYLQKVTNRVWFARMYRTQFRERIWKYFFCSKQRLPVSLRRNWKHLISQASND